MSKNILLTTMSTLPRGLNTNYYLAQDTDMRQKRPRYCDGIAQTEAGTKFFLAQNRIDHIVVIGSDKTYCVDDESRDPDIDSFDTEDLVAESENYSSNVRNFPYRYYKYRIAQFLKNENREQQWIAKPVSGERREYLEKLTSDHLRSRGYNDPGSWFHIVASDKAGSSLSKEIRDLIDSDIRKNFILEEQYQRYLQPVAKYPELKALENEINAIREQINARTITLEKIRLNLHDRYISSGSADLEYEGRLYIQSRRLEEAITDLEIEQYLAKSRSYREVILFLKDAVDRLIMQVQALKSNRLSIETAYIKSWLYLQLDEHFILKPLKENASVSLTFVPDMIADSSGSKIYNISGIINTIRAGTSENDSSPIDLYIDMQGGSRTDGYVRNAILSILNNDSNSNISIRQVVATDFEGSYYTSTIVDETSRYQVINLTSGMNAFIQYGRADLINSYRKSIGVPDNSHVGKLVLSMMAIDQALSVCNITALAEAIESIRNIFDASDSSEITETNELFRVLEDGIRNDYGALVSDPEIDYYELTKWAFQKGFIQQALTIIESKMPREFVRREICFYGDEEREQNIQILKRAYKASSQKDRVYFDDIDNYFIKRSMYLSNTDKSDAKNRDSESLKSKKSNSGNLKKPGDKAQQMRDLLRPSSPDMIKTHTICGVGNMTSVLEKYYIISDLRNKVNHSSERSASFTFGNITDKINEFLMSYKKAVTNIKQKDFHVNLIRLNDIKS